MISSPQSSILYPYRTFLLFFFNDTATTEIYTLSLHDALPIYQYATSQLAQTTIRSVVGQFELDEILAQRDKVNAKLQVILDTETEPWGIKVSKVEVRSEEHTSELQSHSDLVCRLLLEQKKNKRATRQHEPPAPSNSEARSAHHQQLQSLLDRRSSD